MKSTIEVQSIIRMQQRAGSQKVYESVMRVIQDGSVS